MSTEFEDAVLAVINGLEPGELMAYGEVAAEAGFPGAARAVGNLLRKVDMEGLPWWRIVTSTGRLAPNHDRRQAQLLRSEGIRVRNGRVQSR